ncbi:MAG TPA: hypothetical protein VFX33_12785 [Actinomycetales bacterium]|nr:hypothetical protein [Actinomycetales bacterium]
MSIGLVLALLVGAAAVAVGQGASRVLMDLGDGAAWLPTNPRGTVTLVDGSSGRATAEVRLASGDRSSLTVVERDGQVYVLDTSTGVLTRIDGSTFEAPKAVSTPGATSAVLPGDEVVFVVDGDAGVIRILDGETLDPLGSPVDLGAPVVHVVVDKDGFVYPLAPDGTVRVVSKNGVEHSEKLAASAEDVVMSVVAGVVQVTNAGRGTVTAMGPHGPTSTIDVPGLVSGDGILTPEQVFGRYMPYVVPGGKVMTLDTRSGKVLTAKLPDVPGAQWGDPVVTGDLLYVPDVRQGSLYVLEVAGGELRDQVQVTEGKPFALTQDSGIVFANDPATNRAIAIDDSGVARIVSKFDEEVAALAKEPEETPEKLPPPPSPKAPAKPQKPEKAKQPPAAKNDKKPEDKPADNKGNNDNRRDERPGQDKSDKGKGSDSGKDRGGSTPLPNPGAGGPKVDLPPVVPTAEPSPDPVAPGAPSITDLSTGDQSVTVTFAAAAEGGDVDSYSLRVSSGGSPADASVQSQGPDAFVASFTSCGTYDFVVVAKGPGGDTASAPRSAAACVAAGSVRGLSARAQGNDTVVASWQPPAEGTAPFTYRARVDGGAWQDVDGTSASFGVAPGQHTVGVVAIGADGEQGPEAVSAPVTVTPPLVTAGKVQNLSVTATSHTAVRATWSQPTTGTGPFKYEARLAGGQWKNAASGVTFNGLKAATRYTVEVRAIGKDGKPGGVSSASATTNQAPLPPTRRLVECTDNKAMPGGGRKTYYGTSCIRGTSGTGYSITVYTKADPRLTELRRFKRNRDTGSGYIADYMLGTGGPASGFVQEAVVGYVPKADGVGSSRWTNQLYWDHWDGRYSWKSWSYRTSWPGFQPATSGSTRTNQGAVFRVVG